LRSNSTVKSCLSFEKTASSALIFATLGCLAANSSLAQAAPDLSTTTAAAPVESSIQEFPASTDLSAVIEKAEVLPTASQPTVVVLANPISESATSAPSADTSLETTELAASELAVAAPTNSLPLPESPITELETSKASVEPLETKVEDLRPTEHLEAQALPTEGEASDPVSPEATPLDPLEPQDVDDPMAQVNNVSQLSDVRPNDWAFEALRSLVERYGCIAGYPDGTFRGNRAMSRYEFAAGLNACLQQMERLIAGVGSDLPSRQDLERLQRLTAEFQPELTALGTRVDNLEGRVAFVEDHQFSTTTKLFGQAIFGVQGRNENEFDFFLDRFSDDSNNINVIDNVQLSLFTQFSPRSLLLTGLQAGDGSGSGTFLDKYVGLAYEGDTNNDVLVSDLNYRQLFGSKFAVIVGPVGVNAVNVFRGTNRVESAGFGPLSRFAQRNPIINMGGNGGGVGFDWQLGTRFSLQGVYSANRSADPINGGIFGGEEGTTTAGLQFVVSPTANIDISLQYLNSYSPSGQLGTGVGDDLLAVQTINSEGFLRAPIQTNAFGAGIEWRLTPGITVGGWGGYTTSELLGESGNVETVNWMAFLNFPDLLREGNLGGIYIGQPPKITSSDLPDGRNIPSFVNEGDITASEGGQPDTAIHLEGFYRFRVSNNISITPGVIVIFNPNHNDNNDTITIGALRTTFTF
jgi:hypothetical protein